jgi:hypothetical protein
MDVNASRYGRFIPGKDRRDLLGGKLWDATSSLGVLQIDNSPAPFGGKYSSSTASSIIILLLLLLVLFAFVSHFRM